MHRQMKSRFLPRIWLSFNLDPDTELLIFSIPRLWILHPEYRGRNKDFARDHRESSVHYTFFCILNAWKPGKERGVGDVMNVSPKKKVPEFILTEILAFRPNKGVMIFFFQGIFGWDMGFNWRHAFDPLENPYKKNCKLTCRLRWYH